MDVQIPSAVVTAIAVCMVAGGAIPVILFCYFKLKMKCKAIPFLAGVLTMILSAFVLEQILHMLVMSSPIGGTISGNIVLYGLYGAFCAALFEEVGRYITMRYILKKHLGDRKTALMYGAGHGGIECFFILVFGMASNLAIIMTLNSGSMDLLRSTISQADYEQVILVMQTLATTSPATFGLSVVERIFAVVAQLAMSVVMWKAASTGDFKFFGISFAMHFVLDFASVLVNSVAGAVATELVVAIIAFGYAFYAKSVYKQLPELEEA